MGGFESGSLSIHGIRVAGPSGSVVLHDEVSGEVVAFGQLLSDGLLTPTRHDPPP